jgi:hypothetical protein
MSLDKGFLTMRSRPFVLRLVFCLAVVAGAVLPATASASEVVERNASNVELQVAKNGWHC